MSKFTDKISTEWQDAANLVFGVCLIVSPWVLSYAANQTPMMNAVIVGAVIALSAACALYAFQIWEEWLNVVLAAWLIVSPWVLGFSVFQSATISHVVTGVLVGVLALWSANIEHGSGSPMAKG